MERKDLSQKALVFFAEDEELSGLNGNVWRNKRNEVYIIILQLAELDPSCRNIKEHRKQILPQG